MGLEDIFKFGKHQGEQLEDVIEDDPGYVTWLAEENVVDFDEQTLQVLTSKGLI